MSRAKKPQVDMAARVLKRAIQAKVMDRAEPLFVEAGIVFDRGSLLMDLDSCDETGDPLDYEKLLAFPDADFGHDIFGIRRHMDRSSWPGKLKNCFLPRCRLRLKVAS